MTKRYSAGPVETNGGERVSAQFLICAVGTLSAAHKPDFPGLDDFTGECYHTGRWPQEPVSFEGKRVGVIGTGSSGVQAVPVIARAAAHLTVFQRTPQYSIPARSRPLEPELMQYARENWDEVRGENERPSRRHAVRDHHAPGYRGHPPNNVKRFTRSCGRRAASTSFSAAMPTS